MGARQLLLCGKYRMLTTLALKLTMLTGVIVIVSPTEAMGPSSRCPLHQLAIDHAAADE